MLTFGEYSSSLALSAIILGLGLWVLPVLDRTSTTARTIVLSVSTILAWRYAIWRLTETIPPFGLGIEALTAWGFALLEIATIVSSTIAAFILTRTRSRLEEATKYEHWWPYGAVPRVDVYIATYNEELEVLERTIIGAKSLAGPPARIFVLDDGRRPWLAAACEQLGVSYRTRPDNHHAKAGNINYTLSQRLKDPDPPAFIAVLDADFVPHRNFVKRTIALFHDSTVGLVQTPQHFFNPDPIQHNLGVSSGYPDEQRFFFDHVEASRDAWGIAICCGTSSMVRVEAVAQIGGFPTESVTEDFLLTLRLDERGWKTVYLNEPLTEGLAPEGLQEYIVQRGRWCLGLMQIVRNVYSPLGWNGLHLMHRVGLADSVLYWWSTFTFRLASLICPLLFWYLGIAVVNANIPDVISYYLPYYLAVILGLNWISRGLIIPLLNDVSQVVAAWPIVRAAAMGMFTKGPHKFRVTAKGGDRTRVVVQWPLLWPFALLFLLTAGGLVIAFVDPGHFSYDHVAGDGIIIIMFWTLYNLLLLGVAIMACIERPRVDRPLREFVEAATVDIRGEQVPVWISEFGVDHARIVGASGLKPESRTAVTLKNIGRIEASVTEETLDGCRLRLVPSAYQREAILAKLHTTEQMPGVGHGDLRLIIKQLARAFSAR